MNVNNPLHQDYCNAMIMLMERVKEKAEKGDDVKDYMNHLISMVKTLRGDKEEEED